MAKRAAEKYLTDRNVDDIEDDDEPPSEGFEAAPERELSRRPIRGLPSRSNKAKVLSAGNAQPSTMSSNPFATLSSTPTASAPSVAQPQKASVGSIEEHPLVSYFTTLRGINVSVLSTITSLINADPFIDLSEALTKIASKYSHEREKANASRGSTQTTSTKIPSATTTATTTAPALATSSQPVNSKATNSPTDSTNKIPSLFAPVPGGSASLSFGSSSTDKTTSKPPTFSFGPPKSSDTNAAITTTTTADSSSSLPALSSKPQETSDEPVKVNPFAGLNFTIPSKPTPSLPTAPAKVETKPDDTTKKSQPGFSFGSSTTQPSTSTAFSFNTSSKPASDENTTAPKTTAPSYSFSSSTAFSSSGASGGSAAAAPKASFSFIPPSTPARTTTTSTASADNNSTPKTSDPPSLFGFGSASKTASPARASPSAVGFSFGATNSPSSSNGAAAAGGAAKFSFGVPPPPSQSTTGIAGGSSLFAPMATTSSSQSSSSSITTTTAEGAPRAAFGSVFTSPQSSLAPASTSASVPSLFGAVPPPATGSVFGGFGGLKTPPASTPASSATSDVEPDTTATPTEASASATPTEGGESSSVLTGEGAGEEDEKVLHELRCKIYEYSSETQSYDKGTSVLLKLKENTVTGKMRMLGRNLGNGHVRINFMLFNHFKVTPDGKTAMFDGMDGTRPAVYRLRAKDEQDILTFKAQVESAVARL